jgi:hypothetical protein
MKKELIVCIFDKFGMRATAQDAVTFIFQTGLVSPTAMRNWQIQQLFNKLSAADPKRTKKDIIQEISVNDDLGRPSESTVRNAVGVE